VTGMGWGVTPLPEVARALTFQDYGRGPKLEGVYHRPLRKHRALEGWFMEYLRVTGGRAETDVGVPGDFEVRQVSFSYAAPGRLNAFHLHPRERQDELWCVVDGLLAVWLVDVREGSPTAGLRRRYILSGEEPALLHIPSGVAHGYRAGPAGALLVYAVTSQFDPVHPNEARLPWDHFGAGLWEDDRG